MKWFLQTWRPGLPQLPVIFKAILLRHHGNDSAIMCNKRESVSYQSYKFVSIWPFLAICLWLTAIIWQTSQNCLHAQQPVKSSPLPQRDSVRLTPIYCNMLAIICKLSSISPTVQLFTDGLPPTRRPVQSPCDQKWSPQFGNECKNIQSNRQETTSVSYYTEVATWAVTDNYKIFAIKYMYVLNTRG